MGEAMGGDDGRGDIEIKRRVNFLDNSLSLSTGLNTLTKIN